MKKFEDITTVVVGTYPDTKAVASSTPTTPDGTPYLKALLDEYWGFIQAILSHATETPNGVVESAAVGSQILTSIQKIAGHPGELVPWMGSNFAASDPSALGIRLLPLVGQAVLIADYPDLDAMVYVGNGANLTAPAFFRTSDIGGTIRNANGPYINLPDMRGYFVRGYDSTGVVDPSGASHVIGSVQGHAFLDHSHRLAPDLTPLNDIVTELFYVRTSGDKEHVARDVLIEVTPASILQRVKATDVVGGGDSPDETRPVNITARWCIRY